jgi:hypothetical protein
VIVLHNGMEPEKCNREKIVEPDTSDFKQEDKVEVKMSLFEALRSKPGPKDSADLLLLIPPFLE